MERIGSLYQPGGLIFATETGTIIDPSNLHNRSFKPRTRSIGASGVAPAVGGVTNSPS
jgi:integrase